MPTRYIKESARTSKNLSTVSDFDERLFWRLVTCADDFGRFMACPAIVKAACFPLIAPLPVVRIIRALTSLEHAQLIGLYQVGDRQYGWFVNWEKHQGVPRAKTSKYPDPLPTHAGNCGHMPTNVADAPKTNTKTDLNPSALDPPDLKSKIQAQFCEFWKLYPKKVGKGKAEKIWQKLDWSNGLFATICDQVRRASQTEQWKREHGKFIPHPATWLHEKRWEDTYEPVVIHDQHHGFDQKDYRAGTW